MKMFKTLGIIVILLAVFSVALHAKTLKGVTLPDTAIIEAKPCKLVGMGIRKKFFFKIYVGGLYMEHPAHKPKRVISDLGIKRVVMHFLYKEVSAKKLRDAWTGDFKNNLGDKFDSMKLKIDQFNSFFTKPVHKGDEVWITYLPGKGIQVVVKGKEMGTIPGIDFMKAVFSVWFGEIPADSRLKWGMLGEE
jgi:hypothetical protein